MKQDIYETYDNKFKGISAYIILKDGESIGKVTIKYGARLYAYTHIYSTTMTVGIANGGNYDKAFAGVKAGFAKTAPYEAHSDHASELDYKEEIDGYTSAINEALKDEGGQWYNNLNDAGFTVIQAI